jgi:protein-disulfide isomerase
MERDDDQPRLTPPVSEQDHAQGPPTAAVTLVEYGDFECPHCRHAHEILPEVQEHFGDRLRLVFRNFPLAQMHPHAETAAEAAEAAGAQGKFWEMHDLLFEHQDALDEESLLRYARKLKLDLERFERELRDGVHAARVRENFSSGVRSGVNGTPTFFLNGVRYDESWDGDSLIIAIEAEERRKPRATKRTGRRGSEAG